MSGAPARIALFPGVVSCRRDPGGPLGLTLVGRTDDHPDEIVALAFTGGARHGTPVIEGAEGLPESLERASVEQIGAHRYRIASPQREWVVEAASVHVHRDVAGAFYCAVPPRVPPLKKRLFWRVVLALAATSAGKRLLLALRR